jgi:hypothetical protein
MGCGECLKNKCYPKLFRPDPLTADTSTTVGRGLAGQAASQARSEVLAKDEMSIPRFKAPQRRNPLVLLTKQTISLARRCKNSCRRNLLF